MRQVSPRRHWLEMIDCFRKLLSTRLAPLATSSRSLPAPHLSHCVQQCSMHLQCEWFSLAQDQTGWRECSCWAYICKDAVKPHCSAGNVTKVVGGTSIATNTIVCTNAALTFSLDDSGWHKTKLLGDTADVEHRSGKTLSTCLALLAVSPRLWVGPRLPLAPLSAELNLLSELLLTASW